MLRAVGNAVVVNPDGALLEVARAEGWRVMHFEKLGRRLAIAGATLTAAASAAARPCWRAAAVRRRRGAGAAAGAERPGVARQPGTPGRWAQGQPPRHETRTSTAQLQRLRKRLRHRPTPHLPTQPNPAGGGPPTTEPSGPKRRPPTALNYRTSPAARAPRILKASDADPSVNITFDAGSR